MDLEAENQRHLEAAQGWLGLGNWQDANNELENITPQHRADPEVLSVRWGIYSLAGKKEPANEIAAVFSEAMATHVARSRHKTQRTQKARELLLSVVEKSPDSHTRRYCLPC